MVHIAVMSYCSNSCCQTFVKPLASLISSAPCVRKSTELLRHKTLDFTQDMLPPNRSDLNPVDYRAPKPTYNVLVRGGGQRLGAKM